MFIVFWLSNQPYRMACELWHLSSSSDRRRSRSWELSYSWCIIYMKCDSGVCCLSTVFFQKATFLKQSCLTLVKFPSTLLAFDIIIMLVCSCSLFYGLKISFQGAVICHWELSSFFLCWGGVVLLSGSPHFATQLLVVLLHVILFVFPAVLFAFSAISERISCLLL